MIDIHNHILPAVDDGARSIEESIEMLKNAYNAGVTDIILTPHFILDSAYSYEIIEESSILDDLKVKIKNEGININLYLGSEIFVENNLYDLVKTNKVNTLASSRYLLFELSLNNFYHGVYNLLYELNNNGIIPILAHPERYTFIQNNPKLLEELYNHGALIQLDACSFYGKYGRKAKKIFKLAIKHNYASFIASDSHHSKDTNYTCMKSLQKDLLKYISKEKIDDLLNNNPYKIIENQKIDKYKTHPFTKNFLNKWK